MHEPGFDDDPPIDLAEVHLIKDEAIAGRVLAELQKFQDQSRARMRKVRKAELLMKSFYLLAASLYFAFIVVTFVNDGIIKRNWVVICLCIAGMFFCPISSIGLYKWIKAHYPEKPEVDIEHILLSVNGKVKSLNKEGAVVESSPLKGLFDVYFTYLQRLGYDPSTQIIQYFMEERWFNVSGVQSIPGEWTTIFTPMDEEPVSASTYSQFSPDNIFKVGVN